VKNLSVWMIHEHGDFFRENVLGNYGTFKEKSLEKLSA